MMNFLSAPLQHPQRVNRFYDPDLSWDEYSSRKDKLDGHFGHKLFTKFVPNPNHPYHWGTHGNDFHLYKFTDPDDIADADAFVQNINSEFDTFRTNVILPTLQIYKNIGIDLSQDQYYMMDSKYIPTSICM